MESNGYDGHGNQMGSRRKRQDEARQEERKEGGGGAGRIHEEERRIIAVRENEMAGYSFVKRKGWQALEEERG